MTTEWIHFACFGTYFRLRDGDLEYQPALEDGSMESFDEEEGPNIPDPFASDPIKASDRIVIAYLSNPDAPEYAPIRAFLAGSAGDALPIVCAECQTRFGGQCEHF